MTRPHRTDRKPTRPTATHPRRVAPPAQPAQQRPAQQLPAHLREALHHVLSGLTYPAQRWQVLAHAAHWGASPAFCSVLAHLPERTYHSHGAVLVGLTETGGNRVGPSGAVPTPRLPLDPVDANSADATGSGAIGVGEHTDPALLSPSGLASLTRSIWTTAVRTRPAPPAGRSPAPTTMPRPTSTRESR